MKKKLLLGILSVATAICMAFGLSACGETHEHTFSGWYSDANGHWKICTDPNCNTPNKKFEQEAHTGDACSICGEGMETICPPAASEGLNFYLNEDGESYSVGGIGDCKDLDLLIPSTYEGKPVTAIDDNAFIYHDSLKSVFIPNSVTSIGDEAFKFCLDLTDVRLPNSLIKIGFEAFTGCSSLTSIKFPTGMTEIGVNAFGSCTSLTSIEIPDGVTIIEGCAFTRCENLTSITIPSSVTEIGWLAFSDCSSLMEIVFHGTADQWYSITKHPQWDNNTENYFVYCTDAHITKEGVEIRWNASTENE